MHARITNHSLEFSRSLDQLTNLSISFHCLAELRGVFNGLLQGDVELRGHHLGDAIDIAVGNIHGAAHIFDCGLGGHGAEGDDLGDIVTTIFPGDVFDHLAAAVHAEINVDVGQGYALRIQEALKQQLVLERVKIGDAESVGHQRARG